MLHNIRPWLLQQRMKGSVIVQDVPIRLRTGWIEVSDEVASFVVSLLFPQVRHHAAQHGQRLVTAIASDDLQLLESAA
jgi:hypothetical protein